MLRTPRLALLFTLLACTFPAAAAGTGAVRGLVVDARDGTPIDKVSVRVQDSGRSVTTGADGVFELSEVEAGPHDLYVSSVDFILVKRTVVVPAGGTAAITVALTPGTGTYTETVTVEAAERDREGEASPGRALLGSSSLQQLGGVIAVDPMRAVQALPGVVATDDFRSEFSVRGLGASRMNFTFEGVSSPFLVHTLQHVVNAGSIAMVNSDVLDDAVLETGTYAQRFGDRVGAELDLRMREGSRDRTSAHAALAVTGASAVAEGPIGRSRRGSWLVSARRSYIDAFVKHFSPDQSLIFGFTDAQGKLVYDMTPRQQLQFAVTSGTSHTDEPVTSGQYDITHGTNATTLGVLTWRSTPSARFSVAQKVTVAINSFDNLGPWVTDRGRTHEAAYRADATTAVSPSIVLDAGVEARRDSESSRFTLAFLPAAPGLPPPFEGGQFDAAAAWRQSAYAMARITTPRVKLEPGLRLDRWSLTHDTSVSPWLLASIPFDRSVALALGAGVYRQAPSISDALNNPRLQPERAFQVDAGFQGTLGTAGWHVSFYDREDRGFVRTDDNEVRIVPSVNGLIPQIAYAGTRNALDGHARGFEIVLQRGAAGGISGWVAYSFAVSRYHDFTTNENFFGDDDQRHTVNAFGLYRMSDRTSVNARFRYGSNVPVVGYWMEEDGRYFPGEERNTLRVPAYSRLDVRVNRTYAWARARLTLFVEATNVYDRRNVRQSTPQPLLALPFEVAPPFERLTPLIPAVGALVEF